MNELEVIIKLLKTKKSRDPKGFCNEVKEKLEIPDLMKDVDIVSIPKKNKDLMNIDERRGIYIINVFRNIL